MEWPSVIKLPVFLPIFARGALSTGRWKSIFYLKPIDVDETTTNAEKEFITAIIKGKSTKPTDYISVASVHVLAPCIYIFSRDNLKNSLRDTENPRGYFR